MISLLLIAALMKSGVITLLNRAGTQVAIKQLLEGVWCKRADAGEMGKMGEERRDAEP